MVSRNSVSYPIPPSRLRAFTLIELLVVLGIIALLTSLVVTVIGKAMRQANATHCRNNLKQLTIAWRMYAQDNNQKLCSSQTGYFNPSDLPIPKDAVQYFDSSGRQWVCDGPPPEPGFDKILPFVNSIFGTERSIMGGDGLVGGGVRGPICSVRTNPGALWKYTGMLGVYKCKQDGSTAVRSYSMSNIMGMNYFMISDIYEPSEKMVFADTAIDEGLPPISSTLNFSFRHSSGCNLSYVDGHCEFRKVVIVSTDPGGRPNVSDNDLNFFTPKLQVGQVYR
jgi:prepilin-type N-terminal cleavage/methylation domain-containing protein/prepilin-type processing-associated H-X9-DG protein